MRPTLRTFAVALVIVLVLLPTLVFAQQAPAVDTPTAEPPTATVTNTPTLTPTFTPIPSDTPTAISPTEEFTVTPTNTPSAPTPEPPPVPIPEPITTILFGTGLAALSAAVAARRRKK